MNPFYISLFDEHGVTEAEESVFFFDCVLISS